MCIFLISSSKDVITLGWGQKYPDVLIQNIKNNLADDQILVFQKTAVNIKNGGCWQF